LTDARTFMALRLLKDEKSRPDGRRDGGWSGPVRPRRS
jgi:hypothetical protein